MAGRHSFAILLILAAVALPAQAETFKWVDEQGITNYSNKPPAAARAAKSVRTVENRISTYESDPSLKRAAENPGRAGHAEAEWLQRQLEASVESVGVRAHRLPSGAGHDAMILAEITDVGMLFVRCGAGGVSHNPDETVSPEDAALAFEALLHFLRQFAPPTPASTQPA